MSLQCLVYVCFCDLLGCKDVRIPIIWLSHMSLTDCLAEFWWCLLGWTKMPYSSVMLVFLFLPQMMLNKIVDTYIIYRYIYICILWISWCNRNHAQCLLYNMFVSQATGLSRIDQDFAESKKNRSAVQPVNSKWVWIWKVRSNTLKCDHALFIRLSGSIAFVKFYGSAWWVRWLSLAALLFLMLLLPTLRRLFWRLTWKILGNLSGHGTHQQIRKWPMSLRMWRIWSSLWRTSTGMTSWGPWA